MPDNILRVGTEFDVGPLVAGSAAAGASFDELLTKIADTAVEAKQLAQDQEAGARAATVMTGAAKIETAALAGLAEATATTSGAASGLERATASATGRILGMEAGLGMAGGALGRVAAFLPGMGSLFAIALPIALIDMAVERIEQFRDAVEKASQQAENFAIESYKTADALALENLKLEAQIETLQGIPKSNALAEELMEAKIAGEELGRTLEGDIQKSIELLNVGSLSQFFTKASGPEEQFKEKLQEITNKIQEARLALAQAPPGSDAGKAAIAAQIEGYQQFGKQIDIDIQYLQAMEGASHKYDASIAKLNDLKIGAQEAVTALGELNTHTDLSIKVGNLEQIKDRQDAANKAFKETNEITEKSIRTVEIYENMWREEADMFLAAKNKEAETATRTAVAMDAAQIKGAEQAAKAQEDLQVSAIEFKKTEASEALRIEEGIIAASGATARQKAEMLRQAEVGELEQLKSIEAQKLAVILASLSAQQAALGSDVADMAAGKRVAENPGDQEKLNQYLKIQHDIDAARQESVQKDAGYNLQIVAANQHAADQVRDAWQKSMQKVEGAFQSNFDQVVRGTETVKFAFIKMGGDIVIAMLHSLEQMLFQVVSHELAMVAAHAAGAQAQVATSASAASETKAIEGSLAISSIAKSAVKAASAAYAAVSEIPVVGPILAPIAAAGAFAGVMAFGVLVGAAKQGAILSEDSIIAAGAGEMVLPRPISEGLQGAVPALGRFNEAFGGRGGLAPAFAGGGGDGGGGSSSTSNVTHNNFSVQTLDVGTMKDFLSRNQKAISGQIKGAVRNGHRFR